MELTKHLQILIYPIKSSFILIALTEGYTSNANHDTLQGSKGNFMTTMNLLCKTEMQV